MTTKVQQAHRLFRQLTHSAQQVLVAPQRNGRLAACRANGATSRHTGCAQRAPFTY